MKWLQADTHIAAYIHTDCSPVATKQANVCNYYTANAFPISISMYDVY